VPLTADRGLRGAQNGVDDDAEEEEEEEEQGEGASGEAWGQCVVCLNRRKRVVFAPCGHRACCVACARQVRWCQGRNYEGAGCELSFGGNSNASA
jgi:hypothetical protein